MKKQFNFLMVAVLVSTLAISQNAVTLYSDCDYRGTTQMFRAGSYDLGQSRIGGANLSSLRIPQGFVVLLYTSNNPGNGQKIRLTNDVSCLTFNGWNDRAWSMNVEQEMPTQLPENQGMATLYEDCNYRGRYNQLSAGYHDWNAMGIRNDQLSSIRLPRGWSITLYADANFRGGSTTYSYDISCLPSDWNDRVSSVLISNRGNNSGGGGYNPGGGSNEGVTLYENCNYRGISRTLGTGYFDWNQMGVNNDALSSFRVPRGYSITIYSDARYRGRSATYTSDMSCLASDWNDQVSSVYISRNYGGGGNNNNNNDYNNSVIIYEDENFSGRSASVGPGSYSNMRQLGFPDNALSSIQLPRGWRVVLYDQPNFRGSSYTVLRTKDRFMISGWSDRASSMIVYTSGGQY
ncbi:MAG: beta/gamma crystallin-related protein [Chitinophagaceae bacterium]